MNKTDNELLESLLGPVRDPLSTVIPMSILYIVILITGIIGNVCTCIVIVYNRYMHTATNFYLFSLAVSDLLLLILGLPQELFLLWQKYPYIFGEFFCVVRGLSSETSTNASILTITAFTIERYVAICHPLKSHTMSQLPRAIKTILIIWAISAICALPVAWQFGIIFMINKSHQLRNISKQCGMKVIYIEYSFETSAIVFFLIPITLISILYVLIGLNLKYNSQQQQQSHSNPNQNQNIIVLNQQSPTNATTTTTTTTTSLRLSSSARELSTMDNFVNNSSNTTNDSKLNTSNKDNSTDLKHSHLNHQSSLDINNNNSKNQRMSILYQRNNSISSSNQKQIASRRSVIKMLVAVVIAFFFCYSPFHAQRVLATSMHRYKLKSPAIHYVYVLLTHISGITYYLSATINPILYQLMSRKFRLAFKDTFHSCCPCIRRTIPEITYMNIVGSNNYINCASGHYISGYGSSYQLSRVPSFQNSLNAYHNANCAYRRPSSFTNVTNPSILRNNNAVSSTKSIHSFDTNILSTSSSSKRPKLKSTMKSESTSADSAELLDTSLSPTKIAEKQIDYQTTTTSTNIINVTNATALITTTTTTSKSTSSSSLNNPTTTTTLVKFKQFLEVPSVKF